MGQRLGGENMSDEVERFAAFFGMVGQELEGFQKEIVAEIFRPRRETLVLIPRGAARAPSWRRWCSGRCFGSRSADRRRSRVS